MATPEGKVKAKVKEILDEAGAYHHWPVQNGMGAPCLDCHGCHCGRYFAIETKAPGKHLTDRQAKTMRQIQAAGGKVFMIDGGEQGVFELLSWLALGRSWG